MRELTFEEMNQVAGGSWDWEWKEFWQYVGSGALGGAAGGAIGGPGIILGFLGGGALGAVGYVGATIAGAMYDAWVGDPNISGSYALYVS